jgi:putative transport protein
MEIEFTPALGTHLQYGDVITVVGSPAACDKVAHELGNSPKELGHPKIASMFLGIALGIVVGSIPIQLPGAPAPIRLGMAGGPLIVAILLSWVGQLGPIVWYLPQQANFMLREVGIALFLACVGLRAGDSFVATLVQGSGFTWMAWAALITLIPPICVAFVARLRLRTNFAVLCGVLAGSMTDPPALAFASDYTGSEATSSAYATVYPLTMILRVFIMQILVIFLLR